MPEEARWLLGRTEASENDGRGAAHSPEERGVDRTQISGHCDGARVCGGCVVTGRRSPLLYESFD